MKIKNTTKGRKATANEIAKAVILDNLEINGFFPEKSEKLESLSQKEIDEISRHITKHIHAIEKRFNLRDNIDIY